MKPGIFKSTTALAVMVSLAAPLPALSQDKGNKRIDLTQMTTAEIGDLVDRCRKRAEKRQKKLAAGAEIEEKPAGSPSSARPTALAPLTRSCRVNCNPPACWPAWRR